jgi:hypothetical protein
MPDYPLSQHISNNNEGRVVGIHGAEVKYRALIHQDSPLTTANDELGAVCKYSS